jgi:predicted nucleotidyltransferase
VDIAVAIDDLDVYDKLTGELSPVRGGNGIKYTIAGVVVDLIPFGDVEEPLGTVRPRARPDGLNVWGYREVHAASIRCELRAATASGFRRRPGSPR